MQAFFDTECYINYWLLKFKIVNNYYKFEIFGIGNKLRVEDISFIKTIFDNYTTISFNGINYDIPMITGALHGFTAEQLKALNERIITEKMKHWELNLPTWKPKDHIDIMEVAPGAGGLKQYAARIHSKKIQDLPYEPSRVLTLQEAVDTELYCGNDLDVLEDLWNELQPQITQRMGLSKRYGIDLRSKSDAQLAEAVLKKRCEDALRRKIYKNDIDWDMRIKYQPPDFVNFMLPQLQKAFSIIKNSEFRLGNSGSIEMPPELAGLEIAIGNSIYKLGIGGLHSQEKKKFYIADGNYSLVDNDVASYYPRLILNSGKFPEALGVTFLREYEGILNDRLKAKKLQKELKGFENTLQYAEAEVGNEGGKIMINGTFGKTGSHYSILFAPTMLLQTTITGQLSLLMLIEMHEIVGIQVVSANTDGIVIKCEKGMLGISKDLIKMWESVAGLEMEATEYSAIYSRDVNNYFAIKTNGEVKRKGEYAKSGLTEKKNPDAEICSDAVADYLAKGINIEFTIRNCFDIRKFLVVQKVNGGGVKMWGIGADKDAKVRDMIPVLERNGWVKEGRKWRKQSQKPLSYEQSPTIGLCLETDNIYDVLCDATTAYKTCFEPQRPEYLGKVVRWYYGVNSHGTIVYATNGNTVSLSEGAKPCMVLPDTFPSDVDYDWYIRKANSVLEDIGYKVLA